MTRRERARKATLGTLAFLGTILVVIGFLGVLVGLGIILAAAVIFLPPWMSVVLLLVAFLAFVWVGIYLDA